MNLNDFLSSTSSTNDGKAIVSVPTYNWADTMEEEDDYSAPVQQIALPTAPRAARQEIDLSNLPDSPPYTARVGNLSYDVDEDVLGRFFSKMDVTQVRLQKDQGRSKGYGFVEFGDKKSLIEALGLDGETLMARKVKIDIATQSSSSGGRYGDRDRGGRSQFASSEGDADNDWRGSAAANKSAFDSFGENS